MPFSRSYLPHGRAKVAAAGNNYYTTGGELGEDDILTGSTQSTTWTADLSALAGGGGGDITGSGAANYITYWDGVTSATGSKGLQYDGTDITVSSSTTLKPVLTLKNTKTDATAPYLDFFNDNYGVSTPDDGDAIGTIRFYGRDGVGNKQEFAEIYGIADTVSNTTEQGSIRLKTIKTGSLVDTLTAWKGLVGIGTAAPASMLHISGGNANQLRLTAGNTAWDARMYLDTMNANGEWEVGVDNTTFNIANTNQGGTPPFNITYDKKIGIGTTSPSEKLHVVGRMVLDDGDKNVVIGDDAGGTGSGNTAIGFESLSDFTEDTNSYNTAVGMYSMKTLTSGTSNTAMGFYAMGSNRAGTDNNNNVAIGGYALYKASGTNDNVAIGYGAMNDSYMSGNSNVAVGKSAGSKNSSGYGNVYLGYYAGNEGTNANRNVIIGNQAGQVISSARQDVIIGQNAGRYLDTGRFNVMIGDGVGFYTTVGEQNTYLGLSAGAKNVSGSANVCLGYQAGPSSLVDEDNRLYIATAEGTPLIGGNFSSDEIYLNGKVGIGTTDPAQVLDVVGTDVAGVAAKGATIRVGSDIAAASNKGGSIVFGDTGTDRAIIKGSYLGGSSEGQLTFSTAADSGGALTARMTINEDGVGIGTVAPTMNLDVRGDSSDGNVCLISGTSTGSDPIFHVIDSTDNFTALFEGNRAGDQSARIDLWHNPASAHEGSHTHLNFQMNDHLGNKTTYGKILSGIDDYTDATEDGYLALSQMKAGTLTEGMRINSTGVGIGTTAPVAKLEVSGAIALSSGSITDAPGYKSVWASGSNLYWGTTQLDSGAGTVTSVAIGGNDGIDVDSGSPITSDGTIQLGLSNIANSKLANSSVSYGGVSLSLGGTDATPAFDLTDATNYEGTAVKSTGETGGSKFLREDGDGTSSWQAGNAGTVTSVAIGGNDGIDIDSGSPITSAGTIQLGLSSIPNSSLANSSVNYGGVTLSLGGSDTTPAFDLADATNYEGTAVKSTGEGGGTKFLREDGDGTCSWQATAGSTSPGGSDTYVQFNDGGSFGGSANFVWDGTNVGIGTTTPSYKLDVSGTLHTSAGNNVSIGEDGAGEQSIILYSDTAGRYLNLKHYGNYAQAHWGNTHYQETWDYKTFKHVSAGDLGRWNTTGLGIGTTGPTEKLDVRGTTLLSGTTTVNGTFTVSPGNASYIVTQSIKNDIASDTALSSSYNRYFAQSIAGDVPGANITRLTAPASPTVGDEYFIVASTYHNGNPQTGSAQVVITADSGDTINKTAGAIEIALTASSDIATTANYRTAHLICVEANTWAMTISDYGPVA